MRNFLTIFKADSTGGWRLAAGSLVLAALSSCGGSASTTASLQEFINGIVVPPAPANPTATAAGTDANSNGVRDDVERALATRLGTSPTTYAKAINIAAQIQVVNTGTTNAATQALLTVSGQPSCGDEVIKVAQEMALDEVFDTKERYSKAMEAYVAMIEAKIAADDVASLFTTTCP
jgi:hypothetical protein